MRPMERKYAGLVLLSILVLSFSGSGLGTDAPYIMFGTVVDEEGEAIQGADVELHNLRTNVSIVNVTDADGQFYYDLSSMEEGYEDGDGLNLNASYMDWCWNGTGTYVSDRNFGEVLNFTLDTRPRFEHVPLNTIALGEEILLELHASYYGMLDNVSVLYSFDGQNCTSTTDMGLSEGTLYDGTWSVELPSPGGIASMSYIFTASALGREFKLPAIGSYKARIVDNTTPQLSHDQILEWAAGEVIEFRVHVKDEGGISNVSCFMSYKDDPLFVFPHCFEVPMELESGNETDGTWLFVIEDSDEITDVLYYFFAEDIGGNNMTAPALDLEDNPYELHLRDLHPPTIQHAPVLQRHYGDDVLVVANITDDLKVDAVRVYYKNLSDAFFSSLEMEKVDGEYQALLPVADVMEDVHYYVSASDGYNTVWQPENIRYFSVRAIIASGMICGFVEDDVWLLNMRTGENVSADVSDNGFYEVMVSEFNETPRNGDLFKVSAGGETRVFSFNADRICQWQNITTTPVDDAQDDDGFWLYAVIGFTGVVLFGIVFINRRKHNP